MDPIIVFGVAGFTGAVLNGVVGYLGRNAKESFDVGKFGQTVITAVIAGAVVVNASIGSIAPEADLMTIGIMGLLLGYGADAARNGVGLIKK